MANDHEDPTNTLIGYKIGDDVYHPDDVTIVRKSNIEEVPIAWPGEQAGRNLGKLLKQTVDPPTPDGPPFVHTATHPDVDDWVDGEAWARANPSLTVTRDGDVVEPHFHIRADGTVDQLRPIPDPGEWPVPVVGRAYGGTPPAATPFVDEAERDPDAHGCAQVVFVSAGLRAEFEAWLKARGLNLFRIPVGEDDLPTYGIGFGR